MKFDVRRARAATLALALTSLALLTAGGPLGTAHADPESSDRTTVGVRTAGETAADDRGVYHFELEPKAVAIDHLAVSNYSRHPVTVRLLPRDATSTPGAPFAVQESSVEPVDVGAWIAFEKKRIRIPARSEVIVPFQVGVPYDATPGDHVGAIVVSLLAREQTPEAGDIVVDHRVGLRLYLRVPGALRPELAVNDLHTEFDGRLSAFGVGRTTTTYEIENTGNVRLSGDQVASLARAWGVLPDVPLEVGPVEELLPGGLTSVSVTGPRIVAAGPLTTRVSVTPDAGELDLEPETATAEASTFVTPFGLIAVVLAAVACLELARRFRPRSRARNRPRPSTGPGHENKALVGAAATSAGVGDEDA